MSAVTPPGILFVYVEPGAQVSDSEFNAWVDEHVPLRLAIPEFQRTTLWAAADGRTPSRLGVYDVTATSVFASDAYTSLARTLSDHEKDVMLRLAASDRRIYDALAFPSGTPSAEPVAVPASDACTPGPLLLIVEHDVPAELEGELARWYAEECIPLLARVPGWRRSRRFVLREAGPAKAVTSAVSPDAKSQARPAKFLVLHEWEDADPKSVEADMQRAMSTPLGREVRGAATVWETRVFMELKTWEKPESQG